MCERIGHKFGHQKKPQEVTFIHSFWNYFFERAPFKYHSSSQWDIKVTKADKASNGQRQFARKKWINKMIFRERHMLRGKENYRV